ncbi:CMRF35-like molecule 3 isoform X2 [Channa argus]|uniref:CMRF35-like molecule 3 isoform X2 n=1 Tax=Channa argus TaxID=215402 RepID=UPI0035207018
MFTMRKTFVCVVYIFSALTIVETLSVTGHTGKNVTFECSDWNTLFKVKSNAKYLCESPCTKDKHIIIKAEFGKTEQKDRIYLNNTGDVLSVTFADAQKLDSKTYYCGVERYGTDRLLQVNLKVTDARVGSTVSSAVTDSFMFLDSLVIVTDMSHTMLYTTSAASGTSEVGSILFLFIGLTIIITILLVLLKLMRNMKRQNLLKASRTTQELDIMTSDLKTTTLKTHLMRFLLSITLLMFHQKISMLIIPSTQTELV